MAFFKKNFAAEGEHILPVLVTGNGLYIDNAAVTLAAGFPLLQHLGAHIQGIPHKDGPQVLNAFVFQIGNGLAADVRHRHAHGEGEHQRAYHQNAAVLVLSRIIGIGVHGVVVHRQQAEEVVIALKNGFGERVADFIAHDKILKIQTEGGGFHTR